jgi:hypothetical protein
MLRSKYENYKIIFLNKIELYIEELVIFGEIFLSSIDRCVLLKKTIFELIVTNFLQTIIA